MRKLILFTLSGVLAFAQQTTNNATNFGTNVVQNSAQNNGGYIRFSPISYNPFNGSGCVDAYGNTVQQPITTQGAKSFGPDDLLLWNSLSPVLPENGVGCPAATLTANINTTVTTVPVSTAVNIANNNVIQIDTEQMLVTAGGGVVGATNLTVIRSYNVNLYPAPGVVASHTAGTVIGNTLPVNLLYGINTNGYFFARAGLATDQPYYNSIQSYTGGVQAAGYVAGGFYPAGQVVCTAMSGSTCTATRTLVTAEYLGGHVDTGHSAGPPICTGGFPCLASDRNIATATNPLTGNEGLVQGMIYWDDSLACERVYNGTSWSCLGGSSAAGYYCVAGGTSSAITCTSSPAGMTYTTGVSISVLMTVNNAASATININALGAASIHASGSSIGANVLIAGSTYTLQYDGTEFNLVSTTAPGSNTQVIYNSGGLLGATSNFTYASSTLTVAGVTGTSGNYTNGIIAPVFNCANTVGSGGSNVPCLQQYGGTFKIYGNGDAQLQQIELTGGGAGYTFVGNSYGLTGSGTFTANSMTATNLTLTKAVSGLIANGSVNLGYGISPGATAAVVVGTSGYATINSDGKAYFPGICTNGVPSAEVCSYGLTSAGALTIASGTLGGTAITANTYATALNQSLTSSSSPSFSYLTSTLGLTVNGSSGGITVGTNNGSTATSGAGLLINKTGAVYSMLGYDISGVCGFGTGYSGASCTSDGTLKTNIASISGNALSDVLALRPVTFNWKDSGQPGMGFIAQEVQTAVPDFSPLLVTTNVDSGKLSLAMTNMIPLLVKSIQELQAQIDALKK